VAGTASPSATGSGNANLVNQAANSSGLGSTTSAAPVNDITQVPTGSLIYAGGNATTPGVNMRNRGLNQTADQATTTPTNNRTLEQWETYFYTNIAGSQTNLQQFATEAELAGMVSSGATQEQLYAAWQKLLVQAYNHAVSGQQVSPWDVLANSIPGANQGSFKQDAGEKYLNSLTSQQIQDIASKVAAKSSDNTTQKTTVDINYTDPDTARYLINQASQQLLGREATNQEIAAYTKTLNSNEAKFPKMTQSTETTSGTTTTATGAGTAPISQTGEGTSSGGETIVGYDASGNPMYGPTDSSTSSASTAKNVTDTNISLGEADYTRYGREQLAEDAAKSAPDYGAYQAAGPLFQTFLNALKNPVSGVGSNG
jgi:hypothetical protein